MKVHEVMSVDVFAVSPKTPFRDLWEAIFRKHIHSIPVVDANKKLIGIVAEQDLLRPLYPNYQEFIEDFMSATDFEDMEKKLKDLTGLTARHIMNTRVIFTRTDTPILRALSRMIVRSVRQLPVLDEKDVLSGMVSKGDIFDALFKKQLRLEKLGRHKKSNTK